MKDVMPVILLPLATSLCLLCGLGWGSAAHAQPHIAPNLSFNPQRDAAPASGGVRASAFARADATTSAAGTEVVLHQFSSAPHGAYPANGVIRDTEGNLYGTTNGSYSDIGGGGTNDAGVVFKIDPWGNQRVLYSFTGGADGSGPNGLVRDPAGNLYGTTAGGGASSAGTVFRIDPAGHETVLYSFTGGNDGGSPNGLIRDAKGNLYGTASSGGAGQYGVVFRIDTAGNETVLYAFSGGADGATPYSAVAIDSPGNLYGATNNGGNATGAAGAGVIFKLDATGHETVLYTFTGASDGAEPNAVTRDAKGNLYGTTSGGGDASDSGVVFKLDPTGHETVLYTFTGGNDGGSSDAAVTLDTAGNIFGTTDAGGTAGEGVVFEVDASGHETVLHNFTRGAEGNQPYTAGVILDPECNLYGTTSFSGAGGQGAVYKIDRFGNTSVVYAFPGNEGGQYSYNAGLLAGVDGHLFGTTTYGGGHGVGVLFDFDPRTGNEQVLYTFDTFTTSGFGQPNGSLIRDPVGNFYGTTFIGQADQGFGYGVVYKVDSAGRAQVLHNFTNGADGGNPYAGVIRDAKGNLYGTASGGGAASSGVVFKIDPTGKETVLYTFTGGADGGLPFSALICDPAGNLYGTTEIGGASGAGVVFRIDPSGTETVLYSFTGGDDGGYPLSGVIRDAAGNLYGTTTGGGAASSGVVYEVNTSGEELVLYSFTGADDGGVPYWGSLLRDSSGNLFGTTVIGGTANSGVVFKVDTKGNETVLHSFTGKDDGGTPEAGVIFGPGGQLYGLTAFGGTANVGVLYEITP